MPKKMQVFDPAMCCSTGVCGPTVDPKLPRFAADLEWLKSKGVEVERFNLAQQLAAFSATPKVKQALNSQGTKSLPMILVDGELKASGGYPNRADLARFVGVEFESAPEPMAASGTDRNLDQGEIELIAATSATRNLLFTGKGGVGKTSIACATAVSLADAGKRVLLVSTDPASNLDEVLATEIGMRPTAIEGISGLKAINIDPVKAAHEYKERVVGPYRELLPESAIKSIEEQLSGACTVEIAAFDEFAKLLGDPSGTSEFDHVIFDTAPTGHTLRLLQLPSAWSDFIAKNNSGTSCLGPLAGLTAQRELYERTVAALCDAGTTTVFLVSRPEMTSLAEADRTREELKALGINDQRLVVNGIFRATDPGDRIAIALEQRGQDALAAMPAGLSSLLRADVPLVEHPLIGIPALRRFANGTERMPREAGAQHVVLPPDVSTLLPDMAKAGKGVIMTMGKGGVGKTTVAAEIAAALAIMGHRVHLTTTDPAAHILDATSEPIRNLRVSRIDPVAEVQAYQVRSDGREWARLGRERPRTSRRGPAISLHRGDSGFSRICAGHSRRDRRVRGYRHGSDWPHPSPSRCS